MFFHGSNDGQRPFTFRTPNLFGFQTESAIDLYLTTLQASLPIDYVTSLFLMRLVYARRGVCMDKPFALIIEDDRDIVALFRHIMDLAGYRTEIVLHGGVAVDYLSKSIPDIVLLDLSLPGISGVDILKMMRADERLKNVPVVVITA